MRIRSPLSNLAEVIGEIRHAAQEHGKKLKTNEAATRAVLIDPLLHALGWDSSNTHMVEVEKSLPGSRLDYALFDANGNIRIIVEAKALSKDLDNQSIFMSLVTYAFTVGISDIYVTDGIRWHHYTDFKPGQITPGHVIDLANGDPITNAAYLVERMDAAKYWPYDETIDTLTHKVNELESVVASLSIELARLHSMNGQQSNQDSRTGAIVSHPSAGLDQIGDSAFLTLEQLDNVTGSTPIGLLLPDGTQISVKRWKDVLRECCKFALANNPSIRIPLPDYAGKKVNLLASSPPAKGISYIKQDHNGRPIYIYVNYDANHAVLNAQHVLKQVPKPLLTVPAAVALAKPKETA